ncbi:MAG: DMT family transporter [Rhizobiales bacterium]|nr:DMT family transporter [Hyphomicrobiales bacterium]
MNARALLALFFTVAVWGVGPVFIRTLSVELGPADHLAIRYALVSLAYVAGLAIIGGWRIERTDWPRLAVVSFVGMLGYNLGSAFGFAYVTAGIGSLIIGTQPLLIALLASLVAHERLTMATGIGLAVAFAGTALLVWNDLGGPVGGAEFVAGSALVFLCGVAWAIYVVLSKPLIQKYGAYSITALSISLAGFAILALFARSSTLATVSAMTARNWLDMGFLAVLSTFIATITWNYGVARLPAAAAGAFIYLVPIVGVFSGALLLGEAVTAEMLVGGGLILLGVAIAQFAPLVKFGGKSLAVVALVFAVTMWGLIPVAMRYLILATSPNAAMVLRLYPAGVIAVAVLLVVGVKPIAWRDWGRIAIAALAGNVAYQVLAAHGMQSVPASWTGLIFGLEPVFIALFAVVLAGERLTAWLIAGIGLALLGTLALMLGSSLVPASEVSPLGLLLVTLSTMGWGIYTVAIRPVSQRLGAFEVACLALGLSALPMIFFVPPDLPQVAQSMDLSQWLAVGFAVVFGTFLATAAWNYGLGHMESSLAGVFLYVQPIVAAAGGIVILGEPPTWPLAAGGALIIAGVALAQFGPRLRRTQFAAENP